MSFISKCSFFAKKNNLTAENKNKWFRMLQKRRLNGLLPPWICDPAERERNLDCPPPWWSLSSVGGWGGSIWLLWQWATFTVVVKKATSRERRTFGNWRRRSMAGGSVSRVQSDQVDCQLLTTRTVAGFGSSILLGFRPFLFAVVVVVVFVFVFVIILNLI